MTKTSDIKWTGSVYLYTFEKKNVKYEIKPYKR